MPTQPGPAMPFDRDDGDPQAHTGRGWTTTLRRTLQPVRGARENAHEALLECQVRSAQRLAAGLIPPPRGPAD